MDHRTRSPYWRTFAGQLEFWLLTVLREEFARNLHNWPLTYYGGLNAIDLYLDHSAYSPFLLSSYSTKLEIPGWRQDHADQVAAKLEQEWHRRETGEG